METLEMLTILILSAGIGTSMLLMGLQEKLLHDKKQVCTEWAS